MSDKILFSLVVMLVVVATIISVMFADAYFHISAKLQDINWQVKSAAMRGELATETINRLRDEVELLKLCLRREESE